ncbi:saccharopine dehydrogenase [Massilia sp. Root418]|uniref:hypothetical protein n=1 Tax=Massilia sp. Root418 TaxID=1736532 RepID=UPI0006F6AE84|nr:hypothetical protein [Massilia sp. Root418]KQW93629.1 saccharopine dehydrogenase [Massilia sp. Root418]
MTHAPVLIIGGSGIVGARAARALRRLHPALPIAIGGRDMAKASRVADETGNATAVAVDLNHPSLGLASTIPFSAVATLLKDDTLNSLKFAQARGIPYLSVSSGTFEMAPEVAQYIHHPGRSAVLMASQWLAGAATFPILHYASEFASLDTIRIGVVLDDEDMGGPAAYADYDRITGTAPNALVLWQGRFEWLPKEEGSGTLTSVDGVAMPTQAYSPFDIVGLAAATKAHSIQLDLATGVSASRRRGGPFSTEIIVELGGIRQDGSSATVRHEIVHPQGQAPLTALGVALGLERLLGLAGGAPVQPGLYLPEVLIAPSYAVHRMEEDGARITRKAGGAQ